MDEEDGKGTLLSLDSAACNGVCVCVCFWVAGGGLFYLKYRVHGIAGEAVVSLPLVVDPVDATMKHLVNVSVSMKKA